MSENIYWHAEWAMTKWLKACIVPVRLSLLLLRAPNVPVNFVTADEALKGSTRYAAVISGLCGSSSSLEDVSSEVTGSGQSTAGGSA